MNKKLTVILIIIITLSITILLYFTTIRKSYELSNNKVISSNFTYISKIKTLESYSLNVKSTDFFRPYLLNIRENNFDINKIPVVPDIYFIGYYKFDQRNMVHVLSKGKFYTFNQKDLIFKRYHILKALSYGLVVLDVSEGDIKLIKIKQ